VEGYQLPPRLIPKRKPHTYKALKEREPAGTPELGMVAQHPHCRDEHLEHPANVIRFPITMQNRHPVACIPSAVGRLCLHQKHSAQLGALRMYLIAIFLDCGGAPRTRVGSASRSLLLV
jgi:hypothetical protein